MYLHGGPGSPTNAYDYAFTRKWADDYTVVTWDQRNCGKSYNKNQNDTELTYELMMSDGLEMTKYICDYFDIDKITLLGHSWGTYLGSNLVLKYPEYYDCLIRSLHHTKRCILCIDVLTDCWNQNQLNFSIYCI